MSLSTAEAAVLANPDDEAAWRVYGDALQAAGDPRGELLAVQSRVASFPSDAVAVERERALLAEHAGEWLYQGAEQLLAPTRLARGTGSPLRIEWRYGFPWRVTIEAPARGDGFEGLGETWRLLCSNPSNMRFVRGLVFGSMPQGDDADWTDAVLALREHAPPWLRSLSFERGDYWDISWTRADGLDASFWRAVPRLEELYLELGQIGLSAIDAPALKRFRVISSSVNEAFIGEVARAKWPSLEALSLHLGDPNYGGLGSSGAIEQLLQADPPPLLRHLGLCNATFSDELPGLLLESRWLPQLTSLDLSDGTLGDEGAEVLCANAERFKHLEQLNLSRGYFSDSFVDLLGSKLRNLVLNDLQGEADPDDRYVAVSE